MWLSTLVKKIYKNWLTYTLGSTLDLIMYPKGGNINMNIKEAAEKSGLTKKAIKHYEAVGLISISKNPINDYREFTLEDITKLKLISSLRLLNFSIDEIGTIVSGKKSIPSALEERLREIENQITELNKKKVITTIMLNKFYGFEEFSNEVEELHKKYELNNIDKKLYIVEELKRIFPGQFGKLISSVYDPFLDFDIKNNESNKLWLELIQVLDDLEEPSEKHPVIQIINQNIEGQLQQFKEQNSLFIRSLIEENEEILKTQKNTIVHLFKQLKNDDKFRKQYLEQASMASDLPQLKEQTPFSILLSELSPAYKKFLDVQKRIVNEAEKELGFDTRSYIIELMANSYGN